MGRAPLPGARLPAPRPSFPVRLAKLPSTPSRASSAPEIGASTKPRKASGGAMAARSVAAMLSTLAVRCAVCAPLSETTVSTAWAGSAPSSSVSPSSAEIAVSPFAMTRRPSPTCQVRPARSSVRTRVSPSASIRDSAASAGLANSVSTAVSTSDELFGPTPRPSNSRSIRPDMSRRTASLAPESRISLGRILPVSRALGSKASSASGRASSERPLPSIRRISSMRKRGTKSGATASSTPPSDTAVPFGRRALSRPSFIRASISATVQVGRRMVLPV
jgi:hypothetical protein